MPIIGREISTIFSDSELG